MGGGKSQTSTQSVSIPPEVLARYNSVNATAEAAAANPFKPYGGEFVAPLTQTQTAGIQTTNAAANQAQPYYSAATQGLLGAQQGGANYIGAATNQLGQAQQQGQGYLGAATGAAMAGAMPINPAGLNVGAYMNPYTQGVVGATQAALNQQFGQQQAQQQAEAIRAGAFGGDRAGIQRAQLQGQQALAEAQAIAPLYQQNYNQALAAAQQQQGVGLGAAQANRQAVQQLGTQLAGLGQQGYAQGTGTAQQLAALGQQGFQQGATSAQQLAGLGTAAQTAALQGAQAQLAAGQVGQQTQQALDTAQYQQYLQQQGYPFQVAQFLAGIAEGTGALSGSTTTTTQPAGFFSDERLKEDVKKIGKTNDGQPIYSYKYKGDDRTQIGLMAQDVEKTHPEAVGLMSGYKTVDYKKATEDSERPAKYAGGGLVPDGFDYNSMGGAVTSDMAGEHFARGGYALGGDPTNPYSAAGYVPISMQTTTPRQLMVAPALRAPSPSGLAQAADTGKNIAGLYNFGKSGLMGTEATKDAAATKGLLGNKGEWGGGLLSDASTIFDDKKGAATGGLIVPRHHYAPGGDVNPYDLSSDPLKDTIEEQKSNQLSLPKPGQLPNQQSGLQQLAGLGSTAMGLKGLYDVGSGIASGLPTFLTMFAANGGRIHFDDGGSVPTDIDKLQNILSSGIKSSNQLPLNYNLDDAAQIRGSGLWSGPYAEYGGGLGVGLGGGRLDVDFSRGQAPHSPPQYRGMARWSKSFAGGGLVPRDGYATRGRTDLPLTEEQVAAAPGLVPVDVPAPDETGIPATAKGLAVDRQDLINNVFLPLNEQIESVGKANARNPRSTASGLFQFTQPTWDGLVAKYPEKGWTSRDIMNPQAQREMAPLHANDLLDSFQRSGIDPSAQALRLGWAFGESGGPAFMRAALLNPDAPGTRFASSGAIKSNPNWFFNSDGPNGAYGSQKTASETMNTVLGKFGSGEAGAPRPPGLMGRTSTPRTEGDGSGLIDKATSANYLVPALGFLGSMLASQRPTLGGALGEGLLGGTSAYMAQQKQDAQLQAMQPVIAQRNVEALTALSSGLKQYNAMNGTNLTLEQFSKLKPGEIAKYAGPAAAAAVSGQQTGATPYSYTPEEMAKTVIHYPNGVDIPASADPKYLTDYKAHYASWGDNPYGKSQIAFADKQLETARQKTVSASGEMVPAPGAISTEQQALSGQQRVAASSDFQNKGNEFRTQSIDIENHLDQLSDALTRFKTGADAASRANLDKVMEAIDPQHKFASLHGNDGADYDKIIKSAMAIQIAQLKGLSARAPAAELNALSQQIPNPNLSSDAVRQIVTNLKAHNEYQRKMYDEYDPEAYGYNVSNYQKDFMGKNPYKNFVKEAAESMAPGAGTKEVRSAASSQAQSSAALDWARANPSDPRSAKILQKLGVQ